MKKLIFILSLLVPFLALSPFALQAKFESNGVELVYTPILDTELQNPDLRNPAEVWLELFAGAKHSIDLGQMYVYSDEGKVLEPLIDALNSAAERGVKIRLITEKKMQYATNPNTMARLEKIKNLESKVIDFDKIHHGGISHAKYIVVDHQVAYVGSQNFDSRSLQHIHETGFLLRDSRIVNQVQRIFNLDWKAYDSLAKGKTPVGFRKTEPSASKNSLYLVASPPDFLPADVISSEVELPRLLKEAKEEVRAMVLTYSPTDHDKSYYPLIDNAIREAASRNVKIKLLVSNWNQFHPGIDYLKSLSLVPGVEIRIVAIPQRKDEFVEFGRVVHSKTMTIDGKIAWVGTSNWSGGYLNKTRNLEVVMREERMATRLAALHEQLWNSSYAAKIDVNKDYPKTPRTKEEWKKGGGGK